MKADNVLYTDGHDVTVTDSMFQVKKKWYQLSGITKHGLSILHPDRFPAILLLLLGSIIEVVGAAELIPSALISNVRIQGTWLTANEIAMAIGIVLLLTGAVLMWTLKERYAVSITTAEGEKNVIVSERKEYVTQIVHALNEAFFARLSDAGSTERKRNFIVSGR